MNTILAICCQLALIYCALVRGPHTDKMSLIEATVFNIDEQGEWELHEKYTNQVTLARYAQVFMIDAYKNENEGFENALCFEIEQFHSFIDDTAFLIIKDAPQVIRLKFDKKREAGRLDSFFLAKPSNQELKLKHEYEIVRIIETDKSRNVVATYNTLVPDSEMFLYFYAYAIVENGRETEKRRFVISGLDHDEDVLFAIFNRDQFNFIEGNENYQFALVAIPPDGEVNSAYYAFALDPENTSTSTFENDMKDFVSSAIKVPESLKTLADELYITSN